jgi:serine-threonine kinase receptor-associated protein
MAMQAPANAPLVCHGHSRPINHLEYSNVTEDGVFLISSSKGADPPLGLCADPARDAPAAKTPPEPSIARERRAAATFFFTDRFPPSRTEPTQPDPSHRYLVSDGQPMIRNGETGDWIGTFEGHKGCVWGATLNAPATHAATASADFSARLWNAITGDELYKFEHKHIVKSVCFSGDCQRLLTGGSEKLLRIYDLGNIDAAPYVMEGSPSQIRTAQFTADDSLIMSSCADDNGIRVWDVRTNVVVTTLATDTPVTSIEITENGRYITTADGKNVTFFDAMTFTPVKKWTLPYEAESASVCVPQNRFVAGGADMWTHVHDMATGNEVDVGKGHHGPVHSVRFAPDGMSYASGSEDGTIRLWKTFPEGKPAGR